jgi:hypothetical protein
LAESAEIDAIWIRLVPAQGSHRRETSEGLERIQVVIEKAGERPLNPMVRVTQDIGVELPAEAAGAYDIKFLHEGTG